MTLHRLDTIKCNSTCVTSIWFYCSMLTIFISCSKFLFTFILLFHASYLAYALLSTVVLHLYYQVHILPLQIYYHQFGQTQLFARSDVILLWILTHLNPFKIHTQQHRYLKKSCVKGITRSTIGCEVMEVGRDDYYSTCSHFQIIAKQQLIS